MRVFAFAFAVAAISLFAARSTAQAIASDKDSKDKKSDITIPELVFDGATELPKSTLYRFTVKNRSEFPNELFKASPDLPPIGLNKKAARTTVTLYDGNGKILCGYASNNATNEFLGKLTFHVQQGQKPLKEVYLELHDRKTGSKYKSNLVTLGVEPVKPKKK